MSESYKNKSIIEVPLRKSKEITIKGFHGLGNIICLLPVLDKLKNRGAEVRVFTRLEWLKVFSVVKPCFEWTNVLTQDSSPKDNRTNEFGRLLGEKSLPTLIYR